MRLEAHNFNILTAFDGQEALEVARREKPDLIVLDIMCLKLTVIKFPYAKFDEKYKGNPYYNCLPLALRNRIRSWGEEVGADAYVVKPF